jgi:hypothetical protein
MYFRKLDCRKLSNLLREMGLSLSLHQIFLQGRDEVGKQVPPDGHAVIITPSAKALERTLEGGSSTMPEGTAEARRKP